MRPATTPPELPVPPIVAAPGRAPENPDQGARVHAALLDLLWLAAYVTIMRLFGYRIPRPARRRTPNAAPNAALTTPALTTPAPITATPTRAPRRKHRYLDRKMCLALLAGIDQAVAGPAPIPHTPPPEAAAPEAHPPEASRPLTPGAKAPPRRIRVPVPRSTRHGAQHPARGAPRHQHPPYFQNNDQPRPHTHVHFVTMS